MSLCGKQALVMQINSTSSTSTRCGAIGWVHSPIRSHSLIDINALISSHIRAGITSTCPDYASVHRPGLQVAIIDERGHVTVTEKTGQQLNVAVRDMPMFTKPRQTGHHARISIRDNKILVRTELVRAIVQRTSLVLFECRCCPSTLELSPET